MRPLSFDPKALRQHLLKHKIATLAELKATLGTPTDLTVFRKLKSLDYLSSYSHRGRFYTLREIAHFDRSGLWSHADIWFSRLGSLMATTEEFVKVSPRGLFAEELADILHVAVQDPLHDLVLQQRLRRSDVAGLFLYTSPDPGVARDQVRARLVSQAIPFAAEPSSQVSADELRAAILLFYSLLNEQQRRLYAASESLKLGHGGDAKVAEFLGIDPHTVARGRQQLLEQEVTFGSTRRSGGGRKPTEKKRLK
jgi:hypothetical protein